MKIGTKAGALNILATNPTGLKKVMYDRGKYKWTEQGAWLHIGREINDVPDYIKALYVERRQDKHGPYGQLMCICLGLQP